MQDTDIWNLIERYIDNGFSLKCLSMITDVSIDVIERCYNKENLSQNEISEINAVLWFLGQLYCCDTENQMYLQNIVSALCYYFEVSKYAIARYLGISEEQLNYNQAVFIFTPTNVVIATITKGFTGEITTYFSGLRYGYNSYENVLSGYASASAIGSGHLSGTYSVMEHDPVKILEVFS